MIIKGSYFDGVTAQAYDAELKIGLAGYTVAAIADQSILCNGGDLTSLQITPVLGRTLRVIRLKGDQRFESADLSGVAQLEQQLNANRGFGLVAWLEARWKAVFLCLVGLMLFVTVTILYGLPFCAKLVAFQLPVNIMSNVSEQAITMLDKQVFLPSKLAPERQDQLQQVFAQLVRDASPEYTFKILFRDSPAIGANAFAFPSGTIIFTDELINEATDVRELEGVMLHEMAHVIHRHSLRSLIQNAGVVMVISVLAGDVTSITSLASSIPTMLLETGYSRKFELEADAAAATYYAQHGWPIDPYINMLLRISGDHGDTTMTEFLSTHPGVQHRVQALRDNIHVQK